MAFSLAAAVIFAGGPALSEEAHVHSAGHAHPVGDGSLPLQATHRCGDAAVGRIPVDREVNTVLDPRRGILEFSFLPDRAQADLVFAVDFRNDVTCASRPDIQKVAAHALATWEETRVSECASWREFLQSGDTVVKGVTVNREAVQRYVAGECGG